MKRREEFLLKESEAKLVAGAKSYKQLELEREEMARKEIERMQVRHFECGTSFHLTFPST